MPPRFAQLVLLESSQKMRRISIISIPPPLPRLVFTFNQGFYQNAYCHCEPHGPDWAYARAPQTRWGHAVKQSGLGQPGIKFLISHHGSGPRMQDARLLHRPAYSNPRRTSELIRRSGRFAMTFPYSFLWIHQSSGCIPKNPP